MSTPSGEFKKAMLELIEEAMREVEFWKTCLNCKHFDEQKELCKVCTPPTRPPARVITFGCPAFEEAEMYKLVDMRVTPNGSGGAVIPPNPALSSVVSNPVPRDVRYPPGTPFDDSDDDIPF